MEASDDSPLFGFITAEIVEMNLVNGDDLMQARKATTDSTLDENRTTALALGKRARGAHPTARDWVVVALLLVFFTLNFADKASLGFGASQITADLGIGDAEYGLLSSGFFWLFAAGAVGIGAIFRWINLLWAAPILMLAWVATMIPLRMETSFLVLFVSRMALGFFEGPAHALCQGIGALRFPPRKRALAGSIVNAGSSLGSDLQHATCVGASFSISPIFRPAKPPLQTPPAAPSPKSPALYRFMGTLVLTAPDRRASSRQIRP